MYICSHCACNLANIAVLSTLQVDCDLHSTFVVFTRFGAHSS